MAHYIDVTEDSLEQLRTGLGQLQMLDDVGDTLNNLYLLGITTNQSILSDAEEALSAENDGEAATKLQEISIAIRASSDILYYFLGSGLKISTEDFCYVTTHEGPRTGSFNWSPVKPRVSFTDFSKVVLSSNDYWLRDFHQKYAKAAAAPEAIVRDTEATTPAPATVEPPKKSSSVKISDVIENLLG